MTSGETLFSMQESSEGGDQARALAFSIFTEAHALDDLKKMIRDAVSCGFDAASKPSVIRLHVAKGVASCLALDPLPTELSRSIGEYRRRGATAPPACYSEMSRSGELSFATYPQRKIAV